MKVHKATTSITNTVFGLAEPISNQQSDQDLTLKAQKFFAKVDELKEAMQMMNDLNKTNSTAGQSS